MKNTISNFMSEAKVFGRVYWTTLQALGLVVLLFVVWSYVSGKEIVLVEKGDSIIKSGIVTNVEAKK